MRLLQMIGAQARNFTLMRAPGLIAATVLLLEGAAFACSVPVFRYALEHWPADPYRLTVFHRGELGADARELLPADGLANARLELVDLDDKPAPDMLDLWCHQKADTLPWVVARFPVSTGIDTIVTAGPLSEVMQRLLDSPTRREIVDRLAAGESAVWLLLESGDRNKDDAAEALIARRLEYLMGVLTLPRLDEQDIVNGLVSIAEEDLRLAFSVLRLARDDPEEGAFVQMLLHSERDLAGLQEPMVFPVFGRGRALYALVGAGIRHETIDEAASFLIGKCSCQVKERNPGVDLLMSADWSTVAKTSPELARRLPTLAALGDAAPVSVTAQPQEGSPVSPGTAPGNSRSKLVLILVYAVSPLLSAVAVLLAWRKIRRR